jgi:hypothetical protein
MCVLPGNQVHLFATSQHPRMPMPTSTLKMDCICLFRPSPKLGMLNLHGYNSRVHVGLTEVYVCHRQLRVGPVLFRCICCSPFEAGLAYAEGKKTKPG